MVILLSISGNLGGGASSTPSNVLTYNGATLTYNGETLTYN